MCVDFVNQQCKRKRCLFNELLLSMIGRLIETVSLNCSMKQALHSLCVNTSTQSDRWSDGCTHITSQATSALAGSGATSARICMTNGV